MRRRLTALSESVGVWNGMLTSAQRRVRNCGTPLTNTESVSCSAESLVDAGLGEVDDVPQQPLALALRVAEIQRVVEVDVLFVEPDVSVRAVGARIAECTRARRAFHDRCAAFSLATYRHAVDDDERVDDVVRAGPCRSTSSLNACENAIALGVRACRSPGAFAGEKAVDGAAGVVLDLSVSGAKASEFSEMSPKSKISVRFFARPRMVVSSSVQNSRNSPATRSRPAGLQHGANRAEASPGRRRRGSSSRTGASCD